MGGFVFVVGRSRAAEDPLELARAADEALLAANVAEGDHDHRVLAFEETGAYRLLLSAMSENPAELQRFYAETVEPLVAYDEQYATDLVATVEAFLEADGNVAGTAQRLFTHRHTIRYRLERVRELCGLDVGSSDGREKLSLGLKAMRVLGMSGAAGPASEPGTPPAACRGDSDRHWGAGIRTPITGSKGRCLAVRRPPKRCRRKCSYAQGDVRLRRSSSSPPVAARGCARRRRSSPTSCAGDRCWRGPWTRRGRPAPAAWSWSSGPTTALDAVLGEGVEVAIQREALGTADAVAAAARQIDRDGVVIVLAGDVPLVGAELAARARRSAPRTRRPRRRW